MTETIRWMVDDMGRIPGALWARIEPQGIFGKSDLSKTEGWFTEQAPETV